MVSSSRGAQIKNAQYKEEEIEYDDTYLFIPGSINPIGPVLGPAHGHVFSGKPAAVDEQQPNPEEDTEYYKPDYYGDDDADDGDDDADDDFSGFNYTETTEEKFDSKSSSVQVCTSLCSIYSLILLMLL
ncbi:hypothetical protein WMY93_014673 [Mugilogobius chulae]|uniref:Uncharacterized protein n=1 Tax=Mugilogobius chulae TaxID=88201 RepID=A0AAW0NW58_9GOBI